MSAPAKSLLIVGVGSIGERHLRCFQQTRRVRLSVCELDDSLRETVAKRYGVELQFPSFDEALASPLDAVVIATPAPHHVPLAMRSVDRGLHVLIEKPLSTSVDGVDELIQAVGKRQVVAAVAYTMRCSPALADARAAILSGRFGKPLQVVVVAGQDFPFYRPAYRGTYFAQRASGGGAIQDALTHFINAVEWIVGPTERILADAAHLSLPEVEVEDTVHAIARNGSVLVAYALNQHQAPNESTITVVCQRSTVRIQLHNHCWALQDDPEGAWIEQPCVELQRDDLFIRQAHAFLDAIEGNAPPLCTIAEGAQTLRTNLAILAAADGPPWHLLPNLATSTHVQA